MLMLLIVYGGDPVYPTINCIRDPKEKIDYRGPNFHDPTPTVEEYLKACGRMITQEQLDEILAKEEEDEEEELLEDVTEAGIGVGGSMSEAIDIGDKEDTVDDDEDTEASDENAEELP
ncbi:hypothetical protein O6H91_22G029300 [Diphasiastrum complanatum]|uniref:Uncharacterized protein n=1 Tax=Diphasiastrum complanatum TaxID=34168 RepID=A0ACC2AE28_DIPCM|nr:hypothetical protein O6H91_22G029300 [Diphasiastrum complanatum]